jgi:hypothetical protein
MGRKPLNQTKGRKTMLSLELHVSSIVMCRMLQQPKTSSLQLKRSYKPKCQNFVIHAVTDLSLLEDSCQLQLSCTSCSSCIQKWSFVESSCPYKSYLLTKLAVRKLAVAAVLPIAVQYIQRSDLDNLKRHITNVVHF